MGYEVLALKYRPQIFEDCVGQEEVTKTLKNSIQQGRIGHAYLFTGPRGVGKTSLARIFAKTINCPNVKEATPCNTCSSCVSISKCISMDVIEFDGASNNKVEDIRELISNVDYQPVLSQFKVYIIDEVHMVTNQGFNALLKTLEEPPEHVKFIFATTELQKLPETILSRCQIINFKLIQQTDIIHRLKYICEQEKVTYQLEALNMIASKARGAHRDSQSILDQAIAYSNGNITTLTVQEVTGAIPDDDLLTIIEKIFQKNESEIFVEVQKFIQKGFDLQEVCDRITELLRDLLVLQISPKQAETLLSNSFYKQRLIELSQLASRDGIHYMMQMLSETSTKLKYSNQPSILIELTFLKMCHSADLLPISDLIQEFRTQKMQPVASNIHTTDTRNNQLEKKTVSTPKDDNPLFAKRPTSSPSNLPKNITLEELNNSWETLISSVSKSDSLFGKILKESNARAKELASDNLTIEFTATSARTLHSLDTAARKKLLTDSIFQIFQKNFNIQYAPTEGINELKKKVLINEKPSILEKTEGLKQNQVTEQDIINDPEIKKITQTLNCQIVDIDFTKKEWKDGFQ